MKKTAQPPMARRRFLGVGSAGLVSTALGVPSLAWAGPTRTSPGAEPPVSLGYWKGSDRQPHYRTLLNPEGLLSQAPLPGRLVAAESLAQGDARFADRGVRLTIHGIRIAEGESRSRYLRYFSVDTLLRSHLSGAGEDLKFHAWRYDNRSVENVSAVASFDFPVSPACGLEMALSLETLVPRKTLGRRVLENALFGRTSPVEGPRQERATCAGETLCSLSLGRDPSRPKLLRGLYFVALPSSGRGRLPDWSRYRVRAAGADAAENTVSIVRHGLEGDRPADFSYVTFSVDYPARATDPGLTERGV